MVSLFNADRVQYECKCGEWAALCRLFFCRHCSQLRCLSCAANEIDCTFCGSCLENVPVGEARQKKNRCVNCNICPICAMALVVHHRGEQCFLACATCRWSTLESDVQELPSSVNWPVHENKYRQELDAVVDQMKHLAQNEKHQRDMNKRRSNVGCRLSDRFGLQVMYNKKKHALEKAAVIVPERDPVDVDELADSFYTNAVDLTKSLPLDARIAQPLATGDCPPRPIPMPLKARRALRCLQCDHNLSKLEYSPSSIVFKIQYFARNFVPEIRLSRETELAADKQCFVFLSVMNESVAKSEVVIVADNEESAVECRTPVVELSLTPHDDSEMYAVERTTTTADSPILFTKGHRAGIRLEVTPHSAQQTNTLRLILKYKNELSSMTTANGGEWRETRVRVTLGSS